jgi:hypothetical protein
MFTTQINRFGTNVPDNAGIGFAVIASIGALLESLFFHEIHDEMSGLDSFQAQGVDVSFAFQEPGCHNLIETFHLTRSSLLKNCNAVISGS